ncbi:hypothetical protein [Parendozoicomonas sp. Alg238-R29]|uniref:hypothetical protein n=1 Tax=Parendozoicomonas sp. Alg238-R29 TaxID=2993446 RepID=UPI00248D7666|nr:hypothetical protein [Parendozoicomonas sp. Alg238-R29]
MIASNSDKESAKALLDAAKYYKIVRNFKTIDEPYRFKKAHEILNTVESISHDNVSDKVLELAFKFENSYGTNAILAASKLLWLKFKSPVIIYDSRAYNWLKRKNNKITLGEYKNYRDAWLTEFEKVLPTIKECCSELVSVKKFTQAYELSDSEISSLTSEPWFHERVFDKYLWFNA